MRMPRRGGVDVQALLESERGVPPIPAEMRARMLRHARQAVVEARRTPPPVVLRPLRSHGPARLRWAIAATGVLVLGTLATAAIEWRRPASSHLDAIEPSVPPAPSRVAASPRIAAPDLTALDLPPTPATRPPRRPLTGAEAYAQELRLLRPAREAIAREDFNAALAATAAHARQFPRGRLAEEREAIRIIALAGEGRAAEARLAAAAFRDRFPGSLLRKRVDEAVGRGP